MNEKTLKIELWKKAKGNEIIAPSAHHYKDISKLILKKTGYKLSKDTIRNFMEDRNHPSPSTLDIYATYILDGTQDDPKTFQDFQQWYLEGAKKQRKFYFPRIHKKYQLPIALFVLLVFIGMIIYLSISRFEGKNANYYYEFQNSDLSILENDGWFIFGDIIDRGEFDTIKNLPYLRLRTFLGGGHHSNDDYEPFQKNFLAHPIDCYNCEITVSVIDFNPFQKYQQAGFFLFYNETAIPSLRCSYVSSGNNTNNIYQAILRTGKYDNSYLCPWEEFQSRIAVAKVENDTPSPMIDSIVFQLRIREGNTYFFRYKIDEEDYIPVHSQQLDLPAPKYIAMAAFQGRPDLPHPVYPVADSIYAKFKYVRIEPLSLE